MIMMSHDVMDFSQSGRCPCEDDALMYVCLEQLCSNNAEGLQYGVGRAPYCGVVDARVRTHKRSAAGHLAEP